MSTNDIEEIKKEFAITDTQLNEMFEKSKFVSFSTCTQSESPSGVFIGGQTGAGKGGIDVFSEQEFQSKNENAAVLDVDIYRAFHPYTDEILKKYPLLYAPITAESTGKILSMLIRYAIDNNYNFIHEGTLRNTIALETMKTMPSRFTRYVRVMATSKYESLLTAFERNYEQIALSGYGRFTNVETHNITYDGVLNTIKAIEDSKEDIIIEIFKRGKDMVSPIKIFSSRDDKRIPHEVLIEERLKDEQMNISSRKQRLQKLVEELVPKDDFERKQIELLKEEFKSII